MTKLDKTVGRIAWIEDDLEFRLAGDPANTGKQREIKTEDGRIWTLSYANGKAVSDGATDNLAARYWKAPVLPGTKPRKGDPVKKAAINRYGLPDPLVPFTPREWAALQGDRVRGLAGPRLEAMGRALFPNYPGGFQDIPPNRVLHRLVYDCNESSLSHYLVAIRNPHCFNEKAAAPVLNYKDWTSVPTDPPDRYFEYFTRNGAADGQHPHIQTAMTALNTARSLFEQARFAPPLLPPGFSKIPILFDDIGPVRGDTTPTGPIRLNSRILMSGNTLQQLIQALCAHELFHRIQYAYGFRRGPIMGGKELPYVEALPFQFFSEGTASWSEAFLFGTITTSAKLRALLTHPEVNFFRSSYAACAYWSVYAPTAAGGGGPQFAAPVREFLGQYGSARSAGRFDSAITEALGAAGTAPAIGRTMVSVQLGERLLDPWNPVDPAFVKSTLRVIQLEVGKDKIIRRYLDAFSRDVFLVSIGTTASVSSGSMDIVTEDDARYGRSIHVINGGTATAYTISFIPPGGRTPSSRSVASQPPAFAIGGMTRIGRSSVALDSAGNVIILANGLGTTAFGFEVGTVIDFEHHQTVGSISSEVPETPGANNCDFSVVDQKDIRVVLKPNIPWVTGPLLEQVVRTIRVSGSDVFVTTEMQFRSGVASNVTFGLTSLMRTDRRVRDCDQMERASCTGGDDCDPDSRPGVTFDLKSSHSLDEQEVFHICPGYVLAPFTFTLEGSSGRVKVSISVRYHCEDFEPIIPPCMS